MVKLISHRGCKNNMYGENTFLAIQNALNNKKYSGVEFDVRLTKDKEIVLLHDRNISRVSNGNSNIDDLTLKEVKKYNFGLKIFQTIPRLVDILNICTNKILLIEIKVNNDARLFSEIIVPLIMGRDNIYIISFNRKVLNYIKKYDKNIKVGLICLFKRDLLYKGDIYIIRSKMLNSKIIRKNKKIFVWGKNSVYSEKYYSIIDE